MINTENQYHNLAFWAWNGDMNDEEVIEQIQGFYRQGFGGFFIHARAGLTIPYMGKTWMHACDLAIQEAKRLGLSVWLYDEDGWPSGFAGGKVNALGKDYHIKKLNISYSKQEEVKGTVIAQYKKSTSGYQSCDQNQDADITIYYTSDEHYVDLLNPRVADAFLQYTHDQYFDAFGQYFGNTIKAMFTDEPQVFGQGLVWSNYLPDVFFQLHNYPIQTELYQLFFDNESGKKFRHDYFQTVNYAFYHHYTKPLADWCESHHISLTGHFSAEDGLCDQSACNGGVMSMYPLMQIPAIDFLGRRLPSIVLLKQIESIKNQFDKPFILCETFGCSGWSTTFSQFAWLWSYQAAHGINLACLHISTFSIKGIRKRDYPAFFSYQEPWWHQFHHLSSWMNRLNQLMSVGKKKPKVLVLNPISSIWSLSYLSDDQRHISNQYRLLLENLNDFQIDFDILDESLIEEYCVILNNQIYVNHKPYEMLIVPETINIETHTLKLLMEYNREQGHVVYTNKLPKYVSAISDDSLQQTIKSHRSPIFFQAEDGIRDWSVTGVQTCALPIFLLSGFLIFITIVGYVFSAAMETPVILYFAVGFSIISSFVSYWWSDKIVLAMSDARKIEFEDNKELYRLVEKLCITAGLPLPRIYIINDSAPNAFATGRDPQHAVVAVTSGLLEKLERSELEGVIAHELSHIGNRDILHATVVTILVGVVVLL